MMIRIRSRSRVVLVETVELPADARLAIADRLAGCHADLRELGEEMKRVQVEWGRRRVALEGEMDSLSARVKAGNVESALACPVEYDVEARRRYVVHPESGVVMQESAMTAQDDADLKAQGLVG